jgi:eukaryotic-like serine/threonine-protein kinase
VTFPRDIPVRVNGSVAFPSTLRRFQDLSRTHFLLPVYFTAPLALAPGTRLGVYEVIAPIGEGGMGQVLRARDTKLDRDVAIKILPEAFAHDPDRLARFQREAKTLASLNHPNIAAIYGLEESGGMTALVMELVEGDDLSQRIAKGAIPLDEALLIAKQIAEALEAAHEQGIIHRDLKPANIKVTRDGVAKVLDFGLAKLSTSSGQQGASAAALSISPTTTSPAMMTGVGMILGTAAYMSPEQVKGREADKRSDIWAFGCVLYEMLTGRRAFPGNDMSEVFASILARDPDWTALPGAVPPAIRALLRRCLDKNRRERIADIAAALFVLKEQASLAAPVGTASVAPPPHKPLWRRVGVVTAGALVVAAVTGAAVWFATRQADAMLPRVSRFTIAWPGTATLTINANDRDLAITPDGSRVVYVGNNGTQLFVRALDTLEPAALYTGAPRGPFVSPDGQWIGFVEAGNTLKKVALTGGPAITLATLDGLPRGATWGPDDTIIVATDAPATGLQRIAAAVGPTTVLTRPDPARGEVDFFWPEWLPGGRAVLFTITAVTGGLDAAQVAVLDLQTGTRTVLVRGGSHAHYVASGHLVYAAAGTLRAVPFDLARLQTRGTAVPVVPAVLTTSRGAVDAVVADDGTLAYVSGGGVSGANVPRTLVWVDRQGRETPIAAPPRAYALPRLSPDGTRIAVGAADQERDLWLWDLARTTLTRLTFEPGADSSPVWTPDSRRLLFSSNRAGVTSVYVQAADGTGSATRVTDGVQRPQNPNAITADGTRVVLTQLTPTRGRDLRLLTLTPTPRVEPLLETRFEERNGSVSPDGHWLAYESNSAGRFEIYVRPFPNAAAGQWQVSSAGGVHPLWARSGRELFYVAPDGALMTVPVEPHDTTWSAGTATKLFPASSFTGSIGREYDVSPDGQRFLMMKEGGGSDQIAAPPQIIVVQHFDEELKRLVPTK